MRGAVHLSLLSPCGLSAFSFRYVAIYIYMCVYICVFGVLLSCFIPLLDVTLFSPFFFSPSFILFFFPSWQLKQRNKSRSGWAFTVHVRFFFLIWRLPTVSDENTFVRRFKPFLCLCCAVAVFPRTLFTFLFFFSPCEYDRVVSLSFFFCLKVGFCSFFFSLGMRRGGGRMNLTYRLLLTPA